MKTPVILVNGQEVYVDSDDNRPIGQLKGKISSANAQPKSWRRFCQTTTLHGVRYITKKEYHWCERLIWAVILTISLFTTATLIVQSCLRYYYDPTVVYIEKNYREWEIKFPAITGCFIQRMNLTKAHYFIEETWKTDTNSSSYEKYMDFLNAVTNTSYKSLNDFKRFIGDEDFSHFSGDDLAKIARRNEMEYYTANGENMGFFEVITELGLCHTYAGNVSYYLTSNPESPPAFEMMTCNYQTPVCSVRIEELPYPIAIYVHSPYEIPAVDQAPLIVAAEHEVDASFIPYEMISAPDLKSLGISQRKCRFTDEPLPGDKFYSYNMCRMRCRKQAMMQICGCVPFFYAADGVKMCDVNGLSCLADHVERILRPLDNKTSCGSCLPTCHVVEYSLSNIHTTHWGFPAPFVIIFRWSIESFPKTRCRRDVLFGITDLFVSFGGIAALFLGCSLISFVEVVDFFILSHIWNRLKK
ncbi:Amiloride-sensitive sodium channel [Nesidiocoris tenuis]|nr:Amiloride-sensitive sodium channel [Nesidiocoris tenuis]